MVTPRPELLSDLQQDLVRLQALEEIRNAFAWLRSHEPQFASWQLQAARIPAPPFGESARGDWLEARFREQGLDDVHRDDVGNVFGIHPGVGATYVALSAHLDTVLAEAGFQKQFHAQWQPVQGEAMVGKNSISRSTPFVLTFGNGT